jgi:hypothetical protein
MAITVTHLDRHIGPHCTSRLVYTISQILSSYAQRGSFIVL